MLRVNNSYWFLFIYHYHWIQQYLLISKEQYHVSIYVGGNSSEWYVLQSENPQNSIHCNLFQSSFPPVWHSPWKEISYAKPSNWPQWTNSHLNCLTKHSYSFSHSVQLLKYIYQIWGSHCITIFFQFSLKMYLCIQVLQSKARNLKQYYIID